MIRLLVVIRMLCTLRHGVAAVAAGCAYIVWSCFGAACALLGMCYCFIGIAPTLGQPEQVYELADRTSVNLGLVLLLATVLIYLTLFPLGRLLLRINDNSLVRMDEAILCLAQLNDNQARSFLNDRLRDPAVSDDLKKRIRQVVH